MNEKHAVVREAGKTIVINEEEDPVLERRVITRSSFQDIKNFFIEWIETGKKADGSKKFSPLGAYWLRHQQRRQYERIVFAPPGLKAPENSFNLWRGYGVESRPGNWSLMRAHICDVICRGIEEHARWVIAWLAQCVQRPGHPGEVALVLRGKQGTGKGVFARAFGALFGQHFVHVTQPRHLMGNFNAHLQDAVVVFADEAFVAGDAQGTSLLKTIITEPTIPIERKFRDVTTARNVIHLIMASNADWVVTAGLEERRFFVLDLSERYAQNHDYFKALHHETTKGGLEAMLHDLLKHDISGINLREAPTTEALREQKLLSLSPLEQWWLQKLTDGCLLADHDTWEQEVERSDLYDDFVDTARKGGVFQPGGPTALGLFLKKSLPDGYPRSVQRRRLSSEGARRITGVSAAEPRFRVWGLPPLSECRRYFDAEMRTEFPWPDEQDENDET